MPAFRTATVGAHSEVGSPIPRWMSLGICAALSGVAGFGLAGLAIADAGLFLPVLVGPLGAAATVALFRCARPRLLEPVRRRVDSLPAFGALAVAAGSLVVN
ncbi:MAG: hypothetical protein QOH10_2755, partial [Actinomycetota bacterium]|nr:hypothetical protein [Actinomycetota bacterium]